MQPPDGVVLAPERSEWGEEEREMIRAKNEAAQATAPDHPSAKDWLALFVVNLALIAVAAAAIWLTLFRRAIRDAPFVSFDKRLFAIGIALLLAAPLLTTMQPFSHTAAGAWWIFAAAFLFALGFVLSGAALRPRRSYGKGALLAAISYLLIGISWTISFNLARGASAAGEVWSPTVGKLVFSFSFGVLFWPTTVAAWFEIFGLEFN